MNDAREAIVRGEGVLAEERAAHTATAALLPEAHEAHEAHTRSYRERDARTSEREEG